MIPRARTALVACVTSLLAVGAAGCAGGDGVTDDDTDEGASALGVARGVDYAWSRPSPKGIKSDGYSFVIRYLSYDTTGKTLSKSEANGLVDAGLDVVCDWEQSADAALNGYSQGKSDAEEAEKQASADGAPSDRPIYFSVDFDAQSDQQGPINAYFDGVASVIGRARTGAYGGYYLIDRLFDAGKIKWGFQAYAWSYGNWDSRAQIRQTQNDASVAGGDVDLDTAMVADYGQWGHDAPKPPPAPPPLVRQKVGASVTPNKDGRLEAFSFNAASNLAHVWQTTPNGSWSNWANLEGIAIDSPSVLANPDGRLEAFVSTVGGTVWHIWQTSAGGSWSSWSELGSLDGATSAPAVVVNQVGRLEVFVNTTSGLQHTWQEASGGWAGWSNLGGTFVGAPFVAQNHDSRLEVFVTTSGGTVWHIWQSASAAWSDWANLGGDARTPPYVARNADGRLELFVTTTSNAVEHIWQKTAGGAWSDWSSLGGSNKSAVSVGVNSDGRLEAFVEGSKGGTWHAWQKTAGGAWSDFAQIDGESGGAPVVANDADGRLEVFASSGGKVQHVWQKTPGGAWSSWASLGAP